MGQGEKTQKGSQIDIKVKHLHRRKKGQKSKRIIEKKKKETGRRENEHESADIWEDIWEQEEDNTEE